MARIAGVDIPSNKAGEISLTYIYGIGRSLSKEILNKAGVEPSKKVQDWTDDEQKTVRDIIAEQYKTEGELRGEVQMNIKRLMDIGCYRGLRHRRGLPVHGQRTHTNARTHKGKAVAIAGKKKVTR